MKRALVIFAIVLASCSQQADTPAVPDAPQPNGGVHAPKAPDSASNIMRIQDIDFASYSHKLASFIGLELGESIEAATPKIEIFFSPQGGSVEDAENIIGSQKTETEFSTFEAQGGKVTLVERVNIRDDSVKAEQFYAIFKGKDDGFILVDYGLKIKCQRGDNTDGWQITPCP